MLNKKSVEDIDVNGKRVLVRCDFNVPLNPKDESKIESDKRIVESLKTINYLIDHNAKLILCSHLGKTGQDKTLLPVAKRLSELLGREVPLVTDILSNKTKDLIKSLNPKDVVLLENTRLYKEEEANNLDFAKALASLGEVFVNDAFGTAHRAHASTEGVTHFLPSVCGFLIKKELDELGSAINDPQRPLVAIVGGSKVSSKIAILESFLEKVDVLLIGGGMTYTFFKAKGINIGKSILEEDKIDIAKDILEKSKTSRVKLLLPVDVVISKRCEEGIQTEIVGIDSIPDDYMALDIGPATIEMYVKEISKAKTILWNGPVGVFELESFEKGTRKIAEAMANSDAKTIIGGGDSAAAVEKYGLDKEMTHISTGGGASLKFMEGKKLVAIEALDERE